MRRKRPEGYVPEVRANGFVRHRVRVEGKKSLRITIPVGPEDPTFYQHYYAARAGQQLDAVPSPPEQKPSGRTFRALCEAYLTALERQVEAGQKSPLTLKQRRSLLRTVCTLSAPEAGRTVGDYHPDMPPAAMLHI
jgi:hypothetical protein